MSDLAAVGSLISSAAVILSIIFLALQIRQANRNQRSLIWQARTDRNVLIPLKDGCAMSKMLAEADGHSPPNEAKLWTFYGFAAAVFWSYEDTLMERRAGTLNPDSWRADVATQRRLIAHPSDRSVWNVESDAMSGRYRDCIDG